MTFENYRDLNFQCLGIKFYWNIAMPIDLYSVYKCIHALMAVQSSATLKLSSRTLLKREAGNDREYVLTFSFNYIDYNNLHIFKTCKMFKILTLGSQIS